MSDDTLTETWAVHFENDYHHALHRLLQGRGLTCRVGADLKVGRTYTHPTKPLRVLLEDGDDYLQVKVLWNGNVQTDREYSIAEWQWLSSPPSTPEGDREMLRRELHILLDIRPRVMTNAEIADQSSATE